MGSPAAKQHHAKGNNQPVKVEATRAVRSVSVLAAPAGSKVRDFRPLFLSSPADRIEIIRAGVGAVETKAFASDLGIPQERFFRMFGIAQATVTRRASKHQPMSIEESEKIVGMAKLVGQVQTMLEQSGDPELVQDFDAPKWLAKWLDEPVPALGGKCPSEYMDTIEGQEMVSRLLSMMQTGAYA
jgi:putative toxin-antitoxin system antitoxin component (TIGR02293 family)